MSRELKVQTREMGRLELVVIHQTAGQWEPEWAPLQGTELGQLIPELEHTELDAALRGWTRPLIDKLGLAPKLVVRKLPLLDRQCGRKKGCVLHDKAVCYPLSGKLPTCYEPGGVGERAGFIGGLLLRTWLGGVYVITVKEPEP